MHKAELTDTLDEYGDRITDLKRTVMVNHEYITGVEFVEATGDTPGYINISSQA